MVTATWPSAQTERRGGAGPVRGLFGGKASPAALFVLSLSHRHHVYVAVTLRVMSPIPLESFQGSSRGA
jgi:hypothetical protein